MRLIWKLLRQHISVPQLAGFFFANLLGMIIVLLSIQFYNDVEPAFNGEDGVIPNEYLIVNKRVSLATGTSAFTPEEIKDIENQPFCKSVGCFEATQYKIYGRMSVGGSGAMGSELFFESVPDQYIDFKKKDWSFVPGESNVVPIVIPRNFLALYNFGFARSSGGFNLSENDIKNIGQGGIVDIDLQLKNDFGEVYNLKGRIVNFSNRLNTMLAPQSFVEWSNRLLAPQADNAPTRLIVEVYNPTDDAIKDYFDRQDFVVDEDKLEAGRTMYFLRVVTYIVMAIGLLISALSFYILMLSIYLLVQKNTDKLKNLLLIGYSPMRVSMPYQMLTIGMNALVLVLAVSVLMVVRGIYMDMLLKIFPTIEEGSIADALKVGLLLFAVVSVFNIIAIRSKINKLK